MKAFGAEFNVLRMNQRNCGGTEYLTSSLYEPGLSGDYRAVLDELIEKDDQPEIFFAGYSMGGNLMLKMAGELGAHRLREPRCVAAVSPSIDLAATSYAGDEPRNLLYKWHFLCACQSRMRRKAKLFPKRYHTAELWRLRTMRE